MRQIQAQALLPRLKTGLAEFGHRPDDGTLKRVIEAIPRQTLDWILFARFDSELEFRAAEDALRAALISAGIVLKPEDSDTLANACFRPKTAASGFPTNVRLPAFPSTDGP